MRRQLEMQADRIEAVLASHKVQGKVWGGTVTPHAVQFQVMTSLATKVSRVSGLADEIAMSLGVPAARVYRQNNAIYVEVARLDAPAVLSLAAVEALAPKPLPPLTALLGQDGAGKALMLKLTSPDVVHVLVAGMTGSGKTYLMRTILASLTRHNQPEDLRLLLIDPKGGRGFEPLACLPHVVGRMVTLPDEAAYALEWAAQEMERRDNERISRPLLVVAIDELADLASASPASLSHLTRLAQRGREAGVHLLAGTQRPAATVLSGLLKANFPVRLVGQVASPEDAKVASGRAGTGAEDLAGRGEFILAAGGRVIRFRAAVAIEDPEEPTS